MDCCEGVAENEPKKDGTQKMTLDEGDEIGVHYGTLPAGRWLAGKWIALLAVALLLSRLPVRDLDPLS